MQSAVPIRRVDDTLPLTLPNIPTTSYTVSGVEMHYCDLPAQGPERGAPLLWIHGLGGWLRNWALNMPYLTGQGYRCIAVDLPGFGNSDKPDAPYDKRYFRKRLSELLDVLGVDKATMIGNSMGGMISLDFAQRQPERVDRLVLVDAAGVVSIRTVAVRVALQVASAGVRSRFSVRRMMRSMRNVLAEQANPHMLAELQLHFSAYEGFTRREHLRRQRALTRALWHIIRTDLRPWLPVITAPTLVVHGKQDKLVPFEAASIMTREIPNAQLAAFEGVGHVPQMEVPDKFNARLAEFLSATPTAAP